MIPSVGTISVPARLTSLPKAGRDGQMGPGVQPMFLRGEQRVEEERHKHGVVRSMPLVRIQAKPCEL